MDAMGLDKAHIFGNSMGRHCAVAFVLANRERVGTRIRVGSISPASRRPCGPRPHNVPALG
jgi:pimeloyl-ACP methyl ester carboxylesterase